MTTADRSEGATWQNAGKSNDLLQRLFLQVQICFYVFHNSVLQTPDRCPNARPHSERHTWASKLLAALPAYAILAKRKKTPIKTAQNDFISFGRREYEKVLSRISEPCVVGWAMCPDSPTAMMTSRKHSVTLPHV